MNELHDTIGPFDPEAELRQQEEDGEGIDSSRYAWPDCDICKGTGYVDVTEAGVALPRPEMCGCVRERQRRHACEQLIFKLFGPDGARMTFLNYNPGSSEGPKPMKVMDLKLNQAALQGCLNYYTHFDKFRARGVGFALQGEPGCGKTHLATATLIALIKLLSTTDKLFDAFYLSVPEMLDKTRKRFDNPEEEDVIEHAKRAEICLLDDIGAEYHRDSARSGMSWVDERLYVILNARLQNNLPTIYTTNLDKKELETMLDRRIVRRLNDKTAAFYPVRHNPAALKAGEDPELRRLLTEMPGKK